MLFEIPNHGTFCSRIIYPEKGEVRSRKVVRRSNFGHVYKFASLKCGRILELESGLEYDRAIIHEFDPDVILFQEQPFLLEYTNENGEIRACFPDLLVYLDDGRATVEEVKPASKAAKPETKLKFMQEKAALQQNGYGFSVVTEHEIRGGLLLNNSRKLLPYRRTAVNAVLKENVLAALQECEMTGRELISQVYGLNNYLLLSLLSQGFISADLTSELSPNTPYKPSPRQSQLALHQLQVFERKCV